mmetsp:Transcript_11380/g.34269  ORF Transcript_11380/g.34269 Transcript_11380/m.34269 type:complete len:627 (+) Transcript_11380:68-1948(+)
MDEVDGIILSQLRGIGTNIDEDITSLKGLPTEALVEGCARCINTINGDDKLSTSLPKSGAMSKRFRVGTELANAMKSMGFGTDVGYNSFLYSSENEARSILMWLVERLPKESTALTAEVLDAKGLLQRDFAREVSQRQQTLWTPSFCKEGGFAWRGEKSAKWQLEGAAALARFGTVPMVTPRTKGGVSAEEKTYFREYTPVVTDQPLVGRDVVASVLETAASQQVAQLEWEVEWTTKGVKSGLSESDYRAKKGKGVRQKMSNLLRKAVMRSEAEGKRAADMMQFLDDFADADTGKSSKFQNQEKITKTDDTDANAPQQATEEEIKEAREAEIGGLESQLETSTEKLTELKSGIATYIEGIARMEEEAADLDEKNAEREEEYTTRKKVLDLLPDAENNIARLKQIVESSAKRIQAVGGKWQGKRAELLATYRQLRHAQGDAEAAAKVQLEQIKVIRGEMKDVADRIKERDTSSKQLQVNLESVQDQMGRTSYTRRIMELVRNIGKQKDDIDKVLIDTRAVQKDISQLQEKIGRIYAETEEFIFKNTKKDEASRRIYKLLVSLHETCEGIIGVVDGTGQILREVRELDEKIEAESNKNMDESLQRITSDLQTMKKENAQLVAQLRGAK